MATFQRAGIYVSESLTPSNGIPAPSGMIAAIAGQHFQGPVGKAVHCTSWGDFRTAFGGFPGAVPVLANPYLAQAVYRFFTQGGSEAWVLRISNSTTPGVIASATLKDNGSAGGLNTLTISAANVGTWGNSIYIDVVQRGGTVGRFDINVYLGAYAQANLVERWIDMSMTATDPRYVVSLINSPVAGSNYITAANLSSATAAPNNAPLGITNVQLASGTDPVDPTTTDRSNAVTAGTSPFDTVGGLLVFAMPGETSTTVLDALLAYAATRRGFVVVDPPQNQTVAQAVTYEQSLTNSGFGGVYYPWVTVSDPAVQTINATKLIPPSGDILAAYARNDLNRGPWFAPAGESLRLSVVGTERLFAPGDLDALNVANVNAIWQKPKGTFIWGTRTMLAGLPTMYIPIRRTLNYIEQSLLDGTAWAVFEPNDPVLWAQLVSDCNTFLEGIRQKRGLVGTSPGGNSPAYYVLCDESINTPATVQQGVVNIQVGVNFSFPAEFLSFMVAQWSGGQAVTALAA